MSRKPKISNNLIIKFYKQPTTLWFGFAHHPEPAEGRSGFSQTSSSTSLKQFNSPLELTLGVFLNYYKTSISPLLKIILKGGCRFEPTCSEYTILAFKKHGLFKGSFLSAVRVLRCNPLSKHDMHYPVE